MARIFSLAKLIVLPLISVIVATDSLLLQTTGAAYRGKYLGPLTSRKHGVTGHVYAVDSRTLHLQSLTYDGLGPDAFFWVGFTDSPGPQGIIVPNERGTKEVLKGYNGEDVTISLPDGLTLRDIKWFAVWCRAYEVNFGDIQIPPNFDYPQPHVVGSLLGQGLSSGPIVVVDAQTILVPDFSFDGQAPDLHFWVGRGAPGPDGIRVPDETGTDAGLVKADKKTLVLSLPGDLTIFDIDYFGVYSRAYNLDYGHVRITPGLNVPPSLRMLGISPQLLSVTPSPYLSTTSYLHGSNALVQPSVSPAYVHAAPTTTAIAPIAHHHQALALPQPQFFHYNTAAAAPANHLFAYQSAAPTTYAQALDTNHIQDGLLYNSASHLSTTTLSHASGTGGYHSVGSNGFSTFTLRTSKGAATSAALY